MMWALVSLFGALIASGAWMAAARAERRARTLLSRAESVNERSRKAIADMHRLARETRFR